MGPKITVCSPLTVPAVKNIFMKHFILTEYLLTTMPSSFIDDAAALATECFGSEGTSILPKPTMAQLVYAYVTLHVDLFLVVNLFET